MLSLEEARTRLLDAIEPLGVETIPLSVAAFRVAAGRAVADLNLPPFDNSAMDGYAVRAADVAQARAEAPVTLTLAGSVAAGQVFNGRIQPGQCVRVFTGSMLPDGADAVVMQEDTQTEAGAPVRVHFLDAVKPWENIRFRGEDVKHGTVLAGNGERLSPGRIGLLAAAGMEQIEVFQRPVIGLLATGSELIESGNQWTAGKIYESNRAMLEPLLRRSGVTVRVYPLVPDTLEATQAALATAFAECDGVVTSGGVSVGELDHVKPAFEKLGGTLDFWKVAIKPGKPFVFGRWGGRRLFGLPGNPVSAFVTFMLLVRPALWRWQGAAEVAPRTARCVLDEPLVNRGDRRHFVRVHIGEDGIARATGPQASHLLLSLAAANALIDVPPGETVAAGESVRVILLDD